MSINTIRKSDAIVSLDADCQFSISNDVVSFLPLIGNTYSNPTLAEIDAEVIRLQAVYDSQLYARTRKAKYDLLNQDEMRYDDVKNSTTTWVDAIDTIKAAHPKP
jgi:hypothetical protein